MHKEINQKAASKLRGLRAEKNLSIEEAAKITGINKDTISRYENSNVSMQLWILNELVLAYGSNLEIFFRDVNDKMQNNNSALA